MRHIGPNMSQAIGAFRLSLLQPMDEKVREGDSDA
jgi:hypothetical protein